MTTLEQHILVIANHSCPCPGLADMVAQRAVQAPTTVRVVAPALNSRLRHMVSDTDGALKLARERLAEAVANIEALGIAASGEVGDSDPFRAIEDTLRGFQASEIIIATYPPPRSNWLERGLVEKAASRFELPVTHLVSRYGLEPEAPAIVA